MNGLIAILNNKGIEYSVNADAISVGGSLDLSGFFQVM